MTQAAQAHTLAARGPRRGKIVLTTLGSASSLRTLGRAPFMPEPTSDSTRVPAFAAHSLILAT
jgi:hypothetical protein